MVKSGRGWFALSGIILLGFAASFVLGALLIGPIATQANQADRARELGPIGADLTCLDDGAICLGMSDSQAMSKMHLSGGLVYLACGQSASEGGEIPSLSMLQIVRTGCGGSATYVARFDREAYYTIIGVSDGLVSEIHRFTWKG